MKVTLGKQPALPAWRCINGQNYRLKAPNGREITHSFSRYPALPFFENECHVREEDKGRHGPCSRGPPIPLRNLFVFLLLVFFLIIGFAFCRAMTAPVETSQISTVPVQTPTSTVASITIITPTRPPAAPVTNVELPAENSEWYIDGWAEDGIVVNMYGREIRFDLAEFRNIQTNAAIVVQCVDPGAKSPDLDFTSPVEQRDRFVYKGNLFWHTMDPSIQRFIFLRPGELQ